MWTAFQPLPYCFRRVLLPLGVQVKRQWGMSWQLGYFFLSYFRYSSQEKVEGVSAITILSLSLGTRVKKESQLLPPSFYELRYSNQGKVEHVRFLLL